jgi:hypothetical protein
MGSKTIIMYIYFILCGIALRFADATSTHMLNDEADGCTPPNIAAVIAIKAIIAWKEYFHS